MKNPLPRTLCRRTAPLLALALTGPAEASSSASYTLPDYPYWSNDTFAIDEALLEDSAADYCARAGASATVEDFFYGDLALKSIDRLGMGLSDDAEIDALLGNLYLSGYFGGIWLRDSLEDTTAVALAAGATVAPGRLTKTAASGAARDRLVFRTLTGTVGKQVELAVDGGPAAVLAANRATIPFFLYLYGYNRGYLEVLIDYPPAGVPSQDGKMLCGEFLDCSSPGIDLAVLERFSPALDALADPANARWRAMDRLVEAYGVSSMEDGRAVWEEILAESTVSLAAYDPLIDLSVGYLLVSEAAALAGMTAWAEGYVEAGRSGLLLQAGLSLWSGAYFMGLASSAPAGTAPTLTCGG